MQQWQQYMPIVYLVILFVIMYLFLIVPQKKRDKKYREMLAAVKTGDNIVTIGGIIGQVSSIKDDTVVIEVGADRTRLTMEKSSIKTVIDKSAD